MQRSYIEANRHITIHEKDPIKAFVKSIRTIEKYKCTDEIEQTNYKVLKNFINNGHIPKSGIIWKNDTICRIYDIKVDNTGRIKYDKQRPIDKPSVYAAIEATEINLCSVKNAIIKAKQAVV